jgi:UDP-N-acetylglucosamine 2-epimerase
MPLSEHARRYLIAEGIRPETIIKIGSPMQEVLIRQDTSINQSNILIQERLQSREYFLLSVHREENVDNTENFTNLLASIEAITKVYNKPIIISTHPRTKIKTCKHWIH